MSEQPHPTLTADFINAFPDGTRDGSSYQDIEDALDKADAPAQHPTGRWLTLPERIAVLARDRDTKLEALRTQLRTWKIEPVL